MELIIIYLELILLINPKVGAVVMICFTKNSRQSLLSQHTWLYPGQDLICFQIWTVCSEPSALTLNADEYDRLSCYEPELYQTESFRKQNSQAAMSIPVFSYLFYIQVSMLH